MQYTMNDVYAYQLLHYFITRYQYQLVRIQNQKHDYWLMNAAQPDYPVICITCESYTDAGTDEVYIRNVHRAILDIIGREGRLLILNTNSRSTAFQKEYAQQILGTPHDIQDAALRKAFTGIEQVPHDVDDAQSECAALTRSLEEFEGQQSTIKKRRMNIRMPKITSGIAIVCLLYFLFTRGMMLYFGDVTTGVIASGAYYKMSVVALQEYWRLFTTGFLHYDIFHLFVNIYALFTVGMVCEKLFKRSQYLTIFLVSLFIGNVFAYIADGNLVNIGMSAGIFGLTAAFIAVLVHNKSIRLPVVRNSVMRIVFLDLLLTMMPNISWIAHIGGFVSGGFLGVLFLNGKHLKTLKMNTAVSFAALIVCMGFLSTKVQRVEPIDKQTDKVLIDGFENAGWSGYAQRMRERFQVVYESEMVK